MAKDNNTKPDSDYLDKIQRLQLRQVELERQNEDLLGKESFLNEVINHAGGPIFVKDDQSRVILANDAFCTIFGLSRSEVLGKTLAENVPEDERAHFLSVDKQVLSDGVKSVCEETLTTNGYATRTIVTTKTRYTDTEGNHFLIGVLNDISERKSLELQLHEKANTDYLTGINNRGHFMRLAELELHRAIRHNMPLSLMMMDIDFFKNINDQYGHNEGDMMLKKLVDSCLSTLRDFDVIGRFGGDEFAIMLPDTGKEDAIVVAERLREAIESLSLKLDQGGLLCKLTVSIGLSSLSLEHNRLDVLLSLADKALYQAKGLGRNMICTI